MDKIAFLLNISLSGIKNLEKEIKIDFCNKQVIKGFNPEKYKVKTIYGENGSGKTAIISAVDIVKNFIINEDYLRDYHNQSLLKDLINKKSKEFRFKCEFVTGIEILRIYQYEVCFSFDQNDEVYVSYECLNYKNYTSRNKPIPAFVCENGYLDLKDAADDDKSAIINDKTRNLLAKQSALFKVFKLLSEDSKLLKDNTVYIYAVIFFLCVFTHFDKEDRHIYYYQRMRLNELKQNNIPLESIIEEFSRSVSANEKRIPIKDFDRYEKEIKALERFIKIFKPQLIRIIIDQTIDKDFVICKLIMDYGDYNVDIEFESAGIKHLIDMYDCLRIASIGGIVFIDELDVNINEVLLGKLIEYYCLYGAGQLCITSHNTEPMSVLRKNSKSIDYLTNDNRIVYWRKNGHYTPDNCYKNGMIEGLPFNVDPSDFISAFEVE